MPLVDDLIAAGRTKEFFQDTSVDLDFVSNEIAKQEFPEYIDDAQRNVAYFPFSLCSSYPNFNFRKRGFTPTVLQNSFAGINDQLIDLEHTLKEHGDDDDHIIGYVKAASFIMPELANASKEYLLSSSKPVPVRCLGVLFRRASRVDDIIEQHNNKTKEWFVSMECDHSWKDAYFLYRNELIPVKDADKAMRDCIKVLTINQYKNHELKALIGGLDGSVNFYGAALTKNPADRTASIKSFVTARPVELASKTKKFFMPFRMLESSSPEKAVEQVENKINELASIKVIGQTNPSEDGHIHEILSDLTIIPTLSHSHSLRSFSISRGTTPTITGVTDATGQESSYQLDQHEPRILKHHSHMIDVPLKGKFKSGESSTNSSAEMEGTDNEEASSFYQSDLPDDFDLEKIMKLSDLQSRLDAVLEKLSGNVSSGKTGEQASEILPLVNEMRNLQKEVADISKSDQIAKIQDEFLQSQIKSGSILTKEKADELISYAVNEQKEKDEKEQKSMLAQQSRLTKLAELGLDPELELDISGADGKKLKVKDRISKIALDDDIGFAMELKLLQTYIASTTAESNEPAPKISATSAELANKNRKLVSGGLKKPVPAGSSSKQKIGRHAFQD